MPVEPVIGGDGKSLGIAAASIIAKVMRDRLMQALARFHPGYGLAPQRRLRHAGTWPASSCWAQAPITAPASPRSRPSGP